MGGDLVQAVTRTTGEPSGNNIMSRQQSQPDNVAENRIILFRFHDHVASCTNKLNLLQHFNPGIRIYGLYGGPEERLNFFRDKLGQYFEHLYVITGRSRRWKWQHGDLVMQQWFRDFGHTLEFSTLHYLEWDMLLLAPLDVLYGHIPAGAIGLSGLSDDEQIKGRWTWWSDPNLQGQLQELLEYARHRYGFNGPYYACLACGSCFPRRFLEKYSQIDIPELSNDEVRLQLFGQILGFDLRDTGFYTWHDPGGERCFNPDNLDIRPREIKKELALAAGCRIFHPFRGVFRHPGIDCTIWAGYYNLGRALHSLKQKLFS